MKHVIGLDVSKGKSSIVIYDQYGQCEYEGELNHTRIDFERLHVRIEELTKVDGQAPHIVFEATGVYSKSVETFFKNHGYTYSRMNPLQANLQMAKMRRHKTDVSDAHELAKTHFKVDRESTYVQDDYYEQMRALTRYYDEVNDEIVVLKSRMHAILHMSFPELEKLITTSSALFLNIVQLYPHPDLVLAHSKTVIKNRLKAKFPGIGDSTACRLIGEIGDIRRFQNAKQLNAYAGIDIMCYQSGNTHYRDRINKRGNKYLRKILYFMMQGMLMFKEKPNHLVDYYYKLKKQPKSKPHKVAIIACVNKFLKVTFQLMTQGIQYDYESALPAQKS